MEKRKAIIVDLDGTMARIDHRLGLIKQEKPDWKAFNAAIPQDSVNQWCLELVHGMKKLNYKIIFVTGRMLSQKVYEDTFDWLQKNNIPNNLLLGRKDQDYRKDFEVKAEIFERDIQPKYDVLFCVDDRKQVVDFWRSIGLICLQCAEGDF